MAQLLVDNVQMYDDWGDYASEDDGDDVEGFTEGVDAYILSDYPGPPCYPITIGETIQGGGKSYRIEHKLGQGAFATIWLAFEIETGTSVALKVHRTNTDAGQAESRIHQDLQQTTSDPNQYCLAISTSIFSLHSDYFNDSHVVLVLPVLGPDLRTFMDSWGIRSDSPTRLRLAKDILKAVAYLHAQGIIHRDLTDRNVMLGLVPGALDQGPTPAERYKQLGRPQKVHLPRCYFVWRPGDLVAPIEWPESSRALVAKTAFLGDFGLAMHAGSPLTDESLPPLTFCAPELLHDGFEPSYQSDTWGFMCIFTVLMTSDRPFLELYASGTLGSMSYMLGPLPREWEGRYKCPEHYPDTVRQEWYNQPESQEDPLGDCLDRRRKDLIGSRERELILEVMRKGFVYEPSQRITPQQLLNDPSFLELMSIHGIE